MNNVRRKQEVYSLVSLSLTHAITIPIAIEIGIPFIEPFQGRFIFCNFPFWALPPITNRSSQFNDPDQSSKFCSYNQRHCLKWGRISHGLFFSQWRTWYGHPPSKFQFFYFSLLIDYILRITEFLSLSVNGRWRFFHPNVYRSSSNTPIS